MAPSKPVALCTQLMPSGKLCRAVSLRNHRYCRAHIRNHRIAERERAHQEAMDRLGAELDAMDLPELLFALNQRLSGIRTFVRSMPEARLTLIVAINRLSGFDPSAAPEPSAESEASPEHPSNQMPATLEGLTPAPSIRSSQNCANHTLSPSAVS